MVSLGKTIGVKGDEGFLRRLCGLGGLCVGEAWCARLARCGFRVGYIVVCARREVANGWLIVMAIECLLYFGSWSMVKCCTEDPSVK